MSRSNDLASLADEATGGITKGEVGLGNVDNTSDATKQTAILAAATKSDVGLANVDNTADSAKPVSTAQQTEIDKLAYQGEPHIIPNMLYPAIDGKGIDGTTTVSSFGTDVTINGRTLQYYYTNIAGSKPIKDPRIGAHFGSQRHKFKSLQLLEQETATEGENVYSVDGREWVRFSEVGRTGSNTIQVLNDSKGNFFDIHNTLTSSFFEVVCYCSTANVIMQTEGNGSTNQRAFKIAVDGGSLSSSLPSPVASAESPLGSRYVDAGSVIHTGISETLGIHTLKIVPSGAYNLKIYGIELIAQDTSNRNNIQIPSQDVVSYGKKFTVSGTPHYNPFATKGDGSASTIPNNTTGDSVATGWAGSTSAYWDSSLDTATSLGLTAWEEGGAFYRPVNGGRIVKWVDSTGTIKTSVNMMPPSAKALGSHSGDATPTGATNWSTQYLPIFSSGAIDHTQAEVAKTFHFREFGNGGANGNPSYDDFSVIPSSNKDPAYVMDDGLTSASGKILYGYSPTLTRNSADSFVYNTFIGTGVSLKIRIGSATGTQSILHLAQNVPYGSHVFKYDVPSTTDNMDFYLDGVTLKTGHVPGNTPFLEEITFYQPKKPPIPEDSVILADYMLMADPVFSTGDQISTINKGSLFKSAGSDIFYDKHASETQAYSLGSGPSDLKAFKVWMNTANVSYTANTELPYFGTNFSTYFYAGADGAVTSGSDGAQSVSSSDHASSNYQARQNHTYGTLGLNKFKSVISGSNAGGTDTYWHFNGMEIHTPIHTSSHYQTFESPYLHELIGGDRNMEQTNLIVSPDGRSWDSLTRDTSYLGNLVLQTVTDTSVTDHAVIVINDEWRGYNQNNSDRNCFNKDFAIAYDRVVCLKDGVYHITRGSFGNHESHIKLNGETVNKGDNGSSTSTHVSATIELKRGDYIQVAGQNSSTINFNYFSITKV